MQRRDFVKLAGTAVLLPSVALASEVQREVLLLPTTLRNWSDYRTPVLRGHVVVRAWDPDRGHENKWGSLARRGGLAVLESLDTVEPIEWGFENIHDGHYELYWPFGHRGGGRCAHSEWLPFLAKLLAEITQDHLDDAQRIGLSSRHRMVVFAGSHRDDLRDESYTYGFSVAFVEGDVEWDGPVHDKIEDLVSAISATL